MVRGKTVYFLVVVTVLAITIAVVYGFRAQGISLTHDPTKSLSPNVLVITVDTLRADYLGINGNTTVKTPDLDALARQGANFTMAISTFSQTNPAHASLFTGAYPVTHKSMTHCVDPIAKSVDTLAEVLKRNGYSTHALYSWPCFEWDTGFNRGFDIFRGVYVKVPGGKDIDRGNDGRADVTTNGVLEWARQKPASPFFLWVHFMDPHYPYTPPPPFDNMYDPDCKDCLDGSWATIDKIHAFEPLRDADIKHVKAEYAGEVSFTDQEIGRLMAGMRSAGLLDNTMIIVLSDHGEAFGDNGLWFHPLIMYNSVVRVPLIFVYPPTLPAGKVVNSITSVVDVMPTILETLKIPLPSQTEGKSLWPLIRGVETPDSRTAYIQTPDDAAIAMVKNRWKMVRNLVDDSSMLFDLTTDPGEIKDLAAVSPQQVATMGEELDKWLVSHGMKLANKGP
ncbi:MAG: sulfatase [Dehalococcoidia bacterium]|nr:sulfatase [Dehalococcoidia bacterium]